ERLHPGDALAQHLRVLQGVPHELARRVEGVRPIESHASPLASACRIAAQSLGAVYGMSTCVIPSGVRASITALATAGGAPFVPASPTPFTPRGLKGFGVTVSPRT